MKALWHRLRGHRVKPIGRWLHHGNVMVHPGLMLPFRQDGDYCCTCKRRL